MLVSQSPPVFSHSPPNSFLSQNYATLKSPFRDIPPNSKLQRSTSFPHQICQRVQTLPMRPILVIKSMEESPSEEDNASTIRIKKRVVFADDKGMSLTHVRMMTEPSNVPPLWSKHFLAELTQGITADPVVSNNKWDITFPQPASDYIKFRQKLDCLNVSLENIIISETEMKITGTVKVVNLSFHKHIFIRSSYDDWTTEEDTICSYVQNKLPSSIASTAYVLHDTFTFDLKLPTSSRRLEFCVCYRNNEREFWDNNDNKNYLLLKRVQLLPRANSSDSFLKNQHSIDAKNKNYSNMYIDATQTKIDSWSEFASWTHLENSTPYW